MKSYGRDLPGRPMAAPPGTWLERQTIPTDGDDLAAVEYLLDARPRWHALAACRGLGPGPWFPEPGEALPAEAAAVCATCPVQVACAEAGRSQQFGYWAGASVTTLRRRLRQEAV